MNTINALVFTLLLMSFLAEVLPSNPDSEIVQDSSSSYKDQEKPVSSTLDKQPRSAFGEPKRSPDITDRILEQSSQRTKDETQESPQAKSNILFPQNPTQRLPTDTSLSESPQMTPSELFTRDSPQSAITSVPPNDVVSFSTEFHLSPESLQREQSAHSSRQFPQEPQNMQNRPLNVDDRNSERSSSIFESGNSRPYNTMNVPINARRPNVAPYFNNNREYKQYGSRIAVYGNIPPNIHQSSPELASLNYNPSNRNSNSNFNSDRIGPSSMPCTQQNPWCGVPDSSRYIGESAVVTKPPTTNRIPEIVPTNLAANHDRRVSPDSNLYAEIVNDFAFKLMGTLNTDGNFVISPMSIFIALSVCYLGSDGWTKSQLEEALGLNANRVHNERLHEGLKNLQVLITPNSRTNQLYLANGVFLGMNITVKPTFEKDIKSYYNAHLVNLDFANPMSSIPYINNWVSANTRGMITSMADIALDSSTKFLLLNAMYFKGIWRTQFSESLTYNGRFFNLEGLEKTVPTMVLYNETFPFLRSEEYMHSFLKLPYQGDDISMILALPHSFEEKPMPNITERDLCRIRDDMKDTRLDTVTIPKFRMGYVRSLQRQLRQLEIKALFNPREVNLSKIGENKDLVVSAIMHKAVIDVNEVGTTASAVTGVRLVPLAYRNTTNFVVNHPFAFYILHEPTGLVLFYGKFFDVDGRRGGSSNRKQGNERRG